MSLFELVLNLLGALAVCVLLYGIALIVRRRLIARRGGTFELSMRRPGAADGHGWTLGVGRYSGERLEWFRIFSLTPWPKYVWTREELDYTARRSPEGIEVNALYEGHVVVNAAVQTGEVELAMSEASLMGFQSWVESGPPGTDWNRGR